MSELIFEFLLNKSIGVFLLTLIIVAARPFVLKWLNASVAYRLWLTIPMYLLLPVDLVEEAINAPVQVFFAQGGIDFPAFNPVQTISVSSFSQELLLIWAVGFLIFGGIFIHRYRILKASLQSFEYNIPVTLNSNSWFHGDNTIKPVKTSLVNMPAVFGCINSYLILPKDFEKYPKQQQLIIVSHELYHLKRSDHRLNLLRVFIKCLFWFNPLIYFADRYVEVDQELSCDLGVIHSAEQFGLRQYGETLINAISNNNSAYLVSRWSYRKLIKVRLQMLKNTGQRKWHNWAAASFAMLSIWTASSVVSGEKVDSVAKVTTAYPIDIVQPRYPIQAVKNNIEGSVTVEFDLTPSGAVLSPRVIKAEPKGVFEEVALKAFSQWRFGKESNRSNLIYTMKFQLAKTPVAQISQQDIRQLKKQLAEIEASEEDVKKELAQRKARVNPSKEEQKLIASLEMYHQQLQELKSAIKSELG